MSVSFDKLKEKKATLREPLHALLDAASYTVHSNGSLLKNCQSIAGVNDCLRGTNRGRPLEQEPAIETSNGYVPVPSPGTTRLIHSAC